LVPDREDALTALNTIDIYIQTSLWKACRSSRGGNAETCFGNKLSEIDVVVHNETGFLLMRSLN
jgi:hypothetical protein